MWTNTEIQIFNSVIVKFWDSWLHLCSFSQNNQHLCSFSMYSGVWSYRTGCWCAALPTGIFHWMVFRSIIIKLDCHLLLWYSFCSLLQGYVGVANSLNAIVIAFRGTQENRWWIEDYQGENFHIHGLFFH